VDAEARARRAAAAGLALLALCYGYVLFRHASRSIGGSDSSGYFNLARAITAGRLVEEITPLARLGFGADDLHLFIPLGYVPGPRPGTMSAFYPPGFPLQLLVAGTALGWRLGPFLLSPAFAVASVLLTYAVGREIGLRRPASFACSVALACLPVLNIQAMQLMSDTAAMAWALATVLCALKARRRSGWALLAGFGFGMGVLVRPASAVLLPAVLVALPLGWRTWALFGAGGLPCAAYQAWFDFESYGSVGRTGYAQGGALADFAMSNFGVRFRHYTHWLSAMMTPVVPALAVLSLFDRRRPPRTRLLLFAWFAPFFLLYCFYGPYEAWWYTRYLLPAVPCLVLGAALVADDLIAAARAPLARKAALAAAGLLLVAVCLVGLNLGRRFRVLETGVGEAVYPETLKWIAPRLPGNAVVLAMQFSGAMKAYGGPTFVRWDYIDAERWPAIRRHIEERGFRIYALVFPFELRDAAPRVPGRWTYLGSNRDAGLFRLD
jgi:4-amino-4-deoxy-L-arabinose transferase-like glycosyltransferase